MKISRLLFLALGIFSVNVFANDAHTSNHSRMCLTAYLAKPVHVGDVEFYVKNQMIGVISIYGAWVDVVRIQDDGYFKDQKDFEEKREFLRVMNMGNRLNVNKFTYQSC